jgi:iron complex outermembrane recepter protein
MQTSKPELSGVTVMQLRCRPTALALAVATFALGLPALAQTPPVQAAPPANSAATPAADEPPPALTQIIVTARKRSESAQTVPVALSAFNADTLERGKISLAQDLQFSVPNAVLTGNDRFTIRGIGNNSLGGDNGIGLALNGATIGLPPQDEFFDLERIEVLRGPQGTLFGRNTTGGALSVFTKRPTADQTGSLSLELGNFKARRVAGMLNIPINDNLRQRFAGYVLKRDGFTHNDTTGNNIDGRDQYSLRSSTRAFLGDELEVNLVVGGYHENSSRTRETKRLCKTDPVLGCSPNELGFDSPDYNTTVFKSLAGPLTSLGYLTAGSNLYAGATNPKDPRTVAADFDATYKVRNEYATLEVAREFDPLILTYVGGYSNFSTEGNTDWDNATLPFRFAKVITYNMARNMPVTTDQLFTTDSFEARNHTQTHELRIVSKGKGPFAYTTGLFYLDSAGSGGFFTYHPFFELIQKIQGRPPETWFVNTETQLSTTKAQAWFGEGQWKASEELRATLGARWTKEDKTTVSRAIILTNTVPFTEKPALSWSWWTGRGSLDYTPSKDLLIYGTVATGYKGGGFNGSNADKPTFEPETVTAYELGLKSEWLNGTLRSNFAAFLNDYKNMQLAQRIAASAITANGDARTSGLEAEILYVPSRAWQLDANVSFLRTRIGEFLTIDAANPAQSTSTKTPAVAVNLAGKKLPHSPETKVKLGTQYSMGIGGDWSATARLDYVWQAQYFAREFNTPTDTIPSWSVANLQVRVANAKETVQVKAYVKNLSNANNITNIIIEDALVGSYRNARYLDPRTFGVQVEYKF